jgi:hypothetical protein
VTPAAFAAECPKISERWESRWPLEQSSEPEHLPSGTGKTHFVEALAQKVIDAGMRVSWFILESLTAAIGRASVDGSTSKTVARITMAESHTGPVARWVRL